MYHPVIHVIAPSYGRPDRAQYMAESWKHTRHSRWTELTLVLDAMDPTQDFYYHHAEGQPWGTRCWGTGTMVARTNEAAARITADIYGWAADDNVFRTEQWDRYVREAFEDPAITTVNTNDLLVGDEKGGVYFVRADVVRALGWFLPPMVDHLYADFGVVALAKRAGTYKYLPDVIIEHQHPYSGKAQWDDRYRAYNNPAQDAKDGAAFAHWWAHRAEQDAEVLRQCAKT